MSKTLLTSISREKKVDWRMASSVDKHVDARKRKRAAVHHRLTNGQWIGQEGGRVFSSPANFGRPSTGRSMHRHGRHAAADADVGREQSCLCLASGGPAMQALDVACHVVALGAGSGEARNGRGLGGSGRRAHPNPQVRDLRMTARSERLR